MANKKIFVTQPSLPDLKEFIPYLEDIWQSKQLTNNGKYHQRLEKEMAEFLGVKYISLFANGTLALVTALQALGIKGEVITTPYSFVATTNALWWNNIKPIFVDIDPIFGNIDPKKIEGSITPQTTAIMPVHVYGNPCNIEKIQKIADNHSLKVVYDAAHAFGVNYKGQSILNFGDLSILSFHATKVYNTIEGGAIVSHDLETKKQIDYLKNFGFENEVTITAPGINSKMNELQAAFGLLQLKHHKSNVEKRKEASEFYKQNLSNIKGIQFLQPSPGLANYNYSYFPIFIDEKEYGKTRDALYYFLKENDIYGRRYFYPLISQLPMYKTLDSANPANLPVAQKTANNVICLPIHSNLEIADQNRIITLIREFAK